ncbi:MAG: hypothetical protein Q7S51_03730 [Gallionellaceae bacterium]|nr:hypothetical protein [Gallionellaceae bacterium]
MKLKVVKQIVFGVFLAIASSASFSLEEFVGKVTIVEPTYLPGRVNFQMDAGNVTCPAGTWLSWQNADQQNNKGVYATLLTALVSGKQVRFYINNGDTTCNGQFLHLF